MRAIHFAASGKTNAEPLCGTWGSMDTDWTDAAGEVTCAACRIALRDAGRATWPRDEAARRGGARG